MVNGHSVITLCGSTKFKEKFIEMNLKLSLEGNIVFSLPLFSKSDNIELSKEDLKTLHDIHMSKIDISDEIFVINVDDYIGNSCKEEIEYAIKNNKTVKFIEKTNYDYKSKDDCIYFGGMCSLNSFNECPDVYPRL